MQHQTFRLKKQMILEGDCGGEGLVLIDGHTGSMCACNASAGAIVGLLEDGATQVQLVRELACRFDILQDRASQDVRGFLQSLSAMGAIEATSAGEQLLPNSDNDAELQLA